MPIDLYTGQPGNGKTALMVERLIAEAKKAERPIFAAGIEGLKPGLAEVLDDPRGWNAKDSSGEFIVPNGSLIFVDEAWKWFGHLHDASRQATPKHVLDLAEHRHRGLDFVWTTQQPNQLYPFVRGLIGSHTHVVRRFGTPMIDVFSWGELVEDVKSSAKRELANRDTRLLPKAAFSAYKSAEIHTIKPRIPFKVMALPLLLVAGGLFAWIAYRQLRPDNMAQLTGGKAAQSASADAPLSSLGPVGASGKREYRNADDYLAAHAPRVPAMPWSAPVYDGREVTADPMVYCMSSGAGKGADGEAKGEGCRCITEQGTPYAMPVATCRDVARNGIYNPYRRRAEGPASPVSTSSQPQVAQVLAAPDAVFTGTSISGRMGQINVEAVKAGSASF